MDVLTTRRPRLRVGARRREPAKILLGFLAACIVVAPACYTTLQHPGIARQNYRRPPSDVACTRCHTRAALRAFLDPERIAREKDPWDRLSHPWWFDARAGTDSAVVDSTLGDAGSMR
jgi:hypothetical protein